MIAPCLGDRSGIRPPAPAVQFRGLEMADPTATRRTPPGRSWGDPAQRSRVEPAGRLRLRTLVYIRWFAVVGQLVSLAVVRYGLGFDLPIGWTLLPVAASAGLNILLTARMPLGTRIGDRAAVLYLAYDVVQLTVLLYLTGGLQNPFAVLILAPVIVSATVLSRASTIALGFVSAAAITVLALWHLPFPWSGARFVLPQIYLLGIWEALLLGIVFIGAYVGSVSGEARQMSDALAATQMALAREQRLSALGGLAAAAAHELGSPLSTIAVVAREMKREVAEGAPLAEDVDLLIEQSARCRDILAGLSQRPETEPGDPFARIPISALAEAAAEPHMGGPIEVRILRPTGTDKGADKGAGKDGGGDERGGEPIVTRSPEVLHGLGSLIENATQFARVAVEVEIDWNATDATIRVRDDGPGFPASLRDRLGEPYVSSRDDEGHMGLGIFIATTLLRRTGAELRFANAPDGGAEVEVRWNRATMEGEERE
jgi:two-component system, sensor histidine kinase RegB